MGVENFSYPKPLSTLPGKSGGAVPPHDLETLWWPDVGYLPNTRPRLPGDTRPLTPGDASERRDAWLEGVLVNLFFEIGAKKRSPSDHSEYYEQVERIRAEFAKETHDEELQQKRSMKRALCSDSGLDLRNVVKVPVASLVYDSKLGQGDDDASKTYFTVDGKKVDSFTVHEAFRQHFTTLDEAGVICEHEDGTFGFTEKIAEFGIPRLEQIEL